MDRPCKLKFNGHLEMHKIIIILFGSKAGL